jgi:sulfopropanediol 3-dehydrogenase
MITYIKKAAKTPETDEAETRGIVENILEAVRENGDDEILRHYSAKFKNWDKKLILSPEEIEQRAQSVSETVKDDLKFAYEQVYGFAVKQRDSMQEFDTDITPGVTLGQRLIPCNSLQLCRMLCSRWTVCTCCFRNHEYCYGQGSRCSLRRGLLTIP